MPSIKQMRVPLGDNYKRVDTAAAPAAPAMAQMPTPSLLSRSKVMIAALPGNATASDGITRQFYGGSNAPRIRLMST